MDYVQAQVKIVLSGIEFQTQVPVPRGPVRPRVLLPVIRAFTGAIVDASERMSREQGREISCRAGCGACCRQLVPIAHSEAHELRELVERMPEPQRTRVLRRFEEATRRLGESGLAPVLADPGRHDEETINRIANEYFRLGIACPFLEDESCSIHPQRPIVCREYLVTSPAERCAYLERQDSVRVPLAAKASTALMQLDDAAGRPYLRWIVLVTLMEWTASNPEGPARPGTELFGRFLERLGKQPEYES
mgnify:CR=1 FL=1